MKILPTVAVTFVLALFAGSAHAQLDRTVYGLELGKPLSIHECALTKVYKKAYVYGYHDADVCFQHQPTKFGDVWKVTEPVSTPAFNEDVKIIFPLDRRPQITVGDPIGTVVDGKLEGIRMKTGGVRTWDIVLDALTKKYGEPSARRDLQESNLMGAKIPVIVAVWTSPELVVEFTSVRPDDVTVGSVEVYTAVLAAKKKATPSSSAGPQL